MVVFDLITKPEMKLTKKEGGAGQKNRPSSVGDAEAGKVGARLEKNTGDTGGMHATINNLSVDRSTSEALRVLRAFQFVSSHEGRVCPADWEEGKDTMIANSDGMRKYLSNH